MVVISVGSLAVVSLVVVTGVSVVLTLILLLLTRDSRPRVEEDIHLLLAVSHPRLQTEPSQEIPDQCQESVYQSSRNYSAMFGGQRSVPHNITDDLRLPRGL